MSDDAPAVGLVGDGDVMARIREGLAAAGVKTATDDATGVLETAPDLVVAIGDRAVAAVAAEAPPVPVIPVDAGSGVRSVPVEAVDALPQAIEDGDWKIERHVPLSVAVDGDTVATAAFDVALLTAQAARISEFEVLADGEVLDRARADGVVVATPAGSTEYARRIDAPVLAPDTGIAVAWIAPFRIDPDRWVVEASPLTVSVKREGATVDLHVDERVVRSVGPDETVSVVGTEPFRVAVFDHSRDRYE